MHQPALCADAQSKFSLYVSGGVKAFFFFLSAAQVMLSVSGRYLLTYQNPNMVQLEPNWGDVFKSIIIVATRNKIPTVYL